MKKARSYRWYGLISPYEYSKMSSHCCEQLLKDVKKIMRDDNLRDLRRNQVPPRFEDLYRYVSLDSEYELYNHFRAMPDSDVLRTEVMLHQSRNIMELGIVKLINDRSEG